MSRRSERSRSYTNAPENASGGSEREEGIGDIEDEEEITRCICGRDEINSSSINPQLEDLLQKQYDISIDPGLFIQCDKCSVWQHGYCVGLFINEDVPEKYWCELCKPELHILIHETDGDERSLYKPVNEKRKKLLSEHMQYDANGKYSSRQRNRRIGGQLSDKENKVVRKERRHYNDVYNEQLQKALRESAKESGLPLEDDGKRSNRKRVKNDDGDGDGDGDGDDDGNGVYGGENSKFEEESETFLDEKSKMVHNDTQDVSNDEGENVTRASEEADSSSLDSKRQKLTSKPSKSKPTYKKQGSKPSKINDKPTVSPLSKDELISQKLKPRYVSDKSSIYELRRRTGAILEWLGRTQLELEDERVNKIEIFDYKENPNEGLASSDEQNRSVIFSFSENLQAMEKLTEQILRWEQKFGKYAP